MDKLESIEEVVVADTNIIRYESIGLKLKSKEDKPEVESDENVIW